jgi:transcription factor 1
LCTLRFRQPREILEVKYPQPHDRNSLPSASVLPFQVYFFIRVYSTFPLMFRILVATGRSAQRRSPTPLLCIQQIHSTITTRQQNSTTAKPAEIPVRAPILSSSAVPADSPPSLSPSSGPDDAVESKIHGETRQPLSHDDGAAENIARSMASIQLTPLKPAQPNYDASEIDPAKPVERVRGSPAKPKDPKEPPKPRKKPGPKPKPKVEGPPKPKGKPGRKPKITECPPAEGNVITLFENRDRTKHATFTSGNIRADYIPYLQWARGYGQGRSIGDNRRINIVSESLCGKTSSHVSLPRNATNGRR